MIALALLLVALQGAKPSVSVQGPSPGVVKLGDSAVAVVTAENVDEAEIDDPEPVEGLRVRGGAKEQASFSSFDGRSLTTRKSFSRRFYLEPTREGTFAIPFVRVRAGGETLKTRELRVEAVRDVTGSKYAFIEVAVPKREYFAHEPIRVTIRFGIDATILGSLVNPFNVQLSLPVQISASWLTELPGAVPIADASKPARPASGTVSLAVNQEPGEARSLGAMDRQGRKFEAFEIQRSFLPGRLGSLDLTGPMLRYSFATRFGRDLFDRRIPTDTQNAFLYGDPVELKILPIPDAGRPADYSGGVGQFRMTADASPRDLKVGESLKLTLRIEGEGNLEFLEPPRLDGLEGFHVYGKIEEKSARERVVTYDLSPLSESAKEIPPISFSYFDTTPPGRFKSVKTAPIPLSVKPLPPGAGLAALPDDASRVVAGVDDIFDMRPVAGAAAAAPRSAPSTTLLAALILAPWPLAAAAWVWSRRRERDLANPNRVRAREAAATARAALALPGEDPARVLTRYLADRLGCADAAIVAGDLADRLAARGIPRELAERAAPRLLGAIDARYSGGAARASDDLGPLVDELETAFRAAERSR